MCDSSVFLLICVCVSGTQFCCWLNMQIGEEQPHLSAQNRNLWQYGDTKWGSSRQEGRTSVPRGGGGDGHLQHSLTTGSSPKSCRYQSMNIQLQWWRCRLSLLLLGGKKNPLFHALHRGYICILELNIEILDCSWVFLFVRLILSSIIITFMRLSK